MILRDKDANTAWGSASDGVLEERRYYCQNWRADVSAIVSDTGKLIEWVKWASYGTPWTLPSGDTDSDGDWDATDSANITGAYELREDAELDGDVDANDVTHANSILPGTGYQTLGRGVLSSTGVNNRKGYAGYEGDGKFAGMKMHVRNRVLDGELGRWGRRDPARYIDGLNLYEYAGNAGTTGVDPMGLLWAKCISWAPKYLRGPINPADRFGESLTWDWLQGWTRMSLSASLNARVSNTSIIWNVIGTVSKTTFEYNDPMWEPSRARFRSQTQTFVGTGWTITCPSGVPLASAVPGPQGDLWDSLSHAWPWSGELALGYVSRPPIPMWGGDSISM